MDDELVIGRVRTAHGVRGELKVESMSGETDHFGSLATVTLVSGDRRHELAVEGVRVVHRAVLLKLAGVDSPEDAKRWRGWEIVAPRRYAAPLREGEYYYGDLVGLRVLCDGTERGVVADVWEGGETVLLGIELPEGGQRLVPFQAAFVGEVDLEAGALELLNDEVLS
ncbi:MAG: ribosome maturation factor RimM [Spirochaetota bacterium]